jgi:hypothetical protein
MSVQWAHLGADRLLVATDEGVWLQRAELGSPGFHGPMRDGSRGTIKSTRNLLDGALATAERQAVRPVPPKMTAELWAWQLVGQWYVAHHSVALLPPLIDRYAGECKRADLARFARRKLIEERGHDEFPLADLRALGYDADALVKAVPPPPNARALVRLARTYATGEHPVDFIGYVYALERDAIRVTDDVLGELARVLPADVDAASGVRAHSFDFDIEHVESAIRFIARLPAADRTRIALACHRTTLARCRRVSTTKDLSQFALNPTAPGVQP